MFDRTPAPQDPSAPPKSTEESWFSGAIPKIAAIIERVLQAIAPDAAWAQAVFPAICGPATAEHNCPMDAYWLPSQDLVPGATDSFRAGQYTIPLPINNYWSTIWVETTVGWSSQLSNGRPANTLAFKGSDQPACSPTVTLSGSAPCGGNTPQSAVTYVPQSAFEDEVIVKNPECLLRTGIYSVDILQGCYAVSSFTSDFPAPYVDTTVDDPRDKFIPTVGSVAPGTADETKSYRSRVNGFVCGFVLRPVGEEIKHSAQIGHRISASGDPAATVFAVDSSILDVKHWVTVVPYIPSVP
jgi:hypothetical protein